MSLDPHSGPLTPAGDHWLSPRVLTASALLVGYPHVAFIIGLVEGLYVLFLIKTAPPAGA